MPWVYLTMKQAVEIHRKTVAVSGGGSLAHLEIAKLDAVLQHIQNDDYYPTIDTKLTHLFFCSCKFHCFEDGNKRIAITLCAQMLLLNGYLLRLAARFNAQPSDAAAPTSMGTAAASSPRTTSLRA